jgi:hypothetical protein
VAAQGGVGRDGGGGGRGRQRAGGGGHGGAAGSVAVGAKVLGPVGVLERPRVGECSCSEKLAAVCR